MKSYVHVSYMYRLLDGQQGWGDCVWVRTEDEGPVTPEALVKWREQFQRDNRFSALIIIHLVKLENL